MGWGGGSVLGFILRLVYRSKGWPANGLEKPEKAVEGSSSSPPVDLHLELGHNRVSVHSWDSESHRSATSVVPAPSPDCKPIDEIMQGVGVVDWSWGSSRDWFIDLRDGRRIRIPVDLRTPVSDGCPPEDVITQKLIQWASSQRVDRDSGDDSCDSNGGSDWGTVGMDSRFEATSMVSEHGGLNDSVGIGHDLVLALKFGGAMSASNQVKVEIGIMVLDGEDPEGHKDLEPMSVEPLVVAFPSGIENVGDKVGKDYRRKVSDWILRRQKAVGKLLGARYVGYEQVVKDLLMDIETRHIQRKANMVGTRRTPSSGRKDYRELKGLVSSVNYQARDSRKGKGKEKVQEGGGGDCCVVPMNVKIISWNVRGLNDSGKRLRIKNMLKDWHANIICLQETKMELITTRTIRRLWRCQYVDWMFLGSIGAPVVSY
jgi:hypothetical protein